MDILWHAIHRGKLCRIRKGRAGSLISEVWSKGSWQPGPDFSKVDFKGKRISHDEADEWMMSYFREKRCSKPARKKKE